MDKIQIVGGTPLEGKIHIKGAKNACLPLMVAGLLTEEPLIFKNVPHLADIETMKELLHSLGAFAEQKDDVLTIQSNNITSLTAPYDIVSKMRASFLVLGPLLARFGKAKVSLPGGCAIGTRPVDLHLMALEQLGAKITIEGGYIHAEVDGRLKGSAFTFPKQTVGGTQNVMMAAVLTEGTTVLNNIALEPECTDLANCLVAMGAKISGIGTPQLVIEGVDRLHGAEHTVIGDRIEAATYAMAAGITRGHLDITGCPLEYLAAVVRALTEAGVEITEIPNGFSAEARHAVIIGTDVMTEVYPGFPTDAQAQFMALMSTAYGASLITETIFENRFMHVPELVRMGANITIHGTSSAIVRGTTHLSGADVMATDLRGSVAMVLAALAAKGTTTISRVYHLDRGYDELEKKLSSCGANIKRISEA